MTLNSSSNLYQIILNPINQQHNVLKEAHLMIDFLSASHSPLELLTVCVDGNND